jgi:hypothetical protein
MSLFYFCLLTRPQSGLIADPTKESWERHNFIPYVVTVQLGFLSALLAGGLNMDFCDGAGRH